MKPFLSDSFTDLTNVAADAVTLIAGLIALAVTILAWKLGRRWIASITTDGMEEYNSIADAYHDGEIDEDEAKALLDEYYE